MATPKKDNPGSSRFKPGQSGNPGGRSPRVGPNGETVAQLARAHTAEAVERLVRVMRGADDDLALKAVQAILDRGWGKPKESVDLDANVTGNVIPVIQFVRQPDPE